MSGQDPVAWLRAQIEARRELALLATANRDPRGDGKRLGGEWRTGCTCEGECQGTLRCETIEGDGIRIYPEGGHDSDQAALIAGNDPQDTIARCEAELAILDDLRAAKARRGAAHADYDAWLRSGADPRTRPGFGVGSPNERLGPSGDLIAGLEHAVRLLASGYRHQPGYAEAWGQREATR